jgi:LPS export ABC transporter protein LptC
VLPSCHVKHGLHAENMNNRFAIIGFVLLILLGSCENEMKEIEAITNARQLPVQTSKQAHYRVTEKGKITHELIATQLDQYQGETDMMLASGGFTVIFYDSLAKENARLTADNGKYEESAKKLTAWGHVQLYNVENERLETEELIYLQDSAKIFTNKRVDIHTSNGSTLHGMGMVSNDSFTKYRILKPVGELTVDKNP